MKMLRLLMLCLLLPCMADAQPYQTVMATNGVVARPSNFWTANSNSIYELVIEMGVGEVTAEELASSTNLLATALLTGTNVYTGSNTFAAAYVGSAGAATVEASSWYPGITNENVLGTSAAGKLQAGTVDTNNITANFYALLWAGGGNVFWLTNSAGAASIYAPYSLLVSNITVAGNATYASAYVDALYATAATYASGYFTNAFFLLTNTGLLRTDGNGQLVASTSVALTNAGAVTALAVKDTSADQSSTLTYDGSWHFSDTLAADGFSGEAGGLSNVTAKAVGATNAGTVTLITVRSTGADESSTLIYDGSWLFNDTLAASLFHGDATGLSNTVKSAYVNSISTNTLSASQLTSGTNTASIGAAEFVAGRIIATNTSQNNIFGNARLGNFSIGGDYTGFSLNTNADVSNYNLLSSWSVGTLWINRPSAKDIEFRENNNTSAQLTIKGTSGNVGVNEISPGSKLSVKGGLSVGTNTTYSKSAAPTAGMIVEGNVGIGTNNPAYPLTLATHGAGSGISFAVQNNHTNIVTVDRAGNLTYYGALVDGSIAPADLAEAKRIVASVESKGGKVDHAKLDAACWGTKTVSIPTGVFKTNTVSAVTDADGKITTPERTEVVAVTREEVQPDQSKRNVSMLISAQAMVAADSQKRITTLEAQVADLLKRVEQLEKAR